ncbi:hypothetical protein K7432_008233 [Basidiobolus ranarum]|uniref:Uncharacterized protein n=1 Tax=Basidiobolus ranarum TaxID=34480 RepID=A0ABR2WS50_9FUNG
MAFAQGISKTGIEIYPLLAILGAGVVGAVSFMGYKLTTDESLRRYRSVNAPVLLNRKG